MPQHQQGAERRGARRSDATGKVEYQILRPTGISAPLQGTAVNISASGVQFTVHEGIAPGAIVLVQASLAGLPGPPLVGLGRVAWCRDGQQPGSFSVGIQFWWIGRADPAARDTILAHVLGS